MQNLRSIRGLVPGSSVACVALAVSVAASGSYHSVDNRPGDDDVRRLMDELRQTREEVQTLRSEVGQLRAEKGDTWLTEQRAAEIRSIVQDVLTDADTRASLLQGGGAAGWDDGFFLSSGDGNFLLQFDGLMQIRHVANYQDPLRHDTYRHGFENTRTQLTLRGHIFNPDFTYLVRADVTRNEPGLVTGLWFLKDAWVRYHLNNDFSIRFGQFKVPFNREELVAPDMQLTVERSLINESLNLGRTQGVELTWATDHFRIMAATGDGGTDSVGGFGLIDPGGAPMNSPALDESVEWALHARAEWKLAGTWDQFTDFTSPPGEPFALMIGAGIHAQKGEHGVRSPPDFFGNPRARQETWWAYTLDVSAEFGGANLFLAWTHHIIQRPRFGATQGFDVHAYGALLQGGYYIWEDFEVFGRFEWGQLNTDLSGTSFHTLMVATVGFNWYLHGHDAKLTWDFGYAINEVDTSWDADIAGFRTDQAGDTGQMVMRTQFQLRF